MKASVKELISLPFFDHFILTELWHFRLLLPTSGENDFEFWSVLLC
jgi:hypothetical protein